MIELSAHVADYFRTIDNAFAGLDAVLLSQSEQVRRNNLIYQTLAEHLERLRHSFTCWRHKCLISDRFNIDRKDSGFPVYQHVLNLSEDQNHAQERLIDLPLAGELREEMLETLR